MRKIKRKQKAKCRKQLAGMNLEQLQNSIPGNIPGVPPGLMPKK